ncbi:MAG: hydroxyacid dehydrogenase [Devosiaceae bacterium]|nr:hydroxyacid dehydrogenase [Devosiaceae bacterium MH13]
MTKPTLIIDAYWRLMDELFSPSVLGELSAKYEIIWGRDRPIPADVLSAALPEAFGYIAAEPMVSETVLARAPQLKVVAEVSGHFPTTIDYAACAERGVEVLSCAPGFRQGVAEMGLAMALSLGRGLVREHEAFRTGKEAWLDDCAGRDFSLFDAPVGFVGYGSIARELHRVIAPFGAQVACYDPWVPAEGLEAAGVEPLELAALMAHAQVLFVTAAPTRDNFQMLSAELLAKLRDGAAVILISRAHLVDFDALLAEVQTGRLKAAIDVYPSEPVAPDHPMRQLSGALFSPHRAAAVEGGRQLIGDLLLRDLDRVLAGLPPDNLNRAAALDIAALAGVSDAASVEQMAADRS